MEVKQGIKIHNRFDIEVRDSITAGELKQTAQAENILLDSIYTRLCGGSSYFVNIHFGTGTGTPIATNPSLFTHLGSKTAVNEELVKAIPVSSWKRKIVLAPEEYVGQTITEVGIAWGSTASYLMTHAMIKDAEGNPISITKTDTDVVTIYATVYVTFDTSITQFDWIGLPSSNTLMDYLIGGSAAPTGSFGLLPMVGAIARLGSTPNATWTSDVVNKKRKTNIPRFDINTANGNALVLEFTNLFQLKFPATGIHAGRAYIDVPLGVGDGTEDTFALPSQNLIDGMLTVKKDGVITSALTLIEKNIFGDQAISNIPTFGWSVSLNSDGTVLAMGSAHIAPYLRVWDWNGLAWIERVQAPNIPTNGQSVSLSSDGTVLAMGSLNVSPYLKVWDWSGTAWIERAQAPNIPEWGQSVSLNSDGTVLAMGSNTIAPYLRVWDWNGLAWIERVQAPNIPTNGQSVSLNSDGSALVIGANTPAYLKVYTNKYITQTSVKFNTVPAEDAVLTVDYTVKGVHKTTNQVIDASFAIQFGEGV